MVGPVIVVIMIVMLVNSTTVPILTQIWKSSLTSALETTLLSGLCQHLKVGWSLPQI